MQSYSPFFIPNFVPIATRVSQGKNRLAAFGGPSTKPRFRCKNLADISYTDRVIAFSVPNFVATATGVGRGKCNWQHSMAHPRKPPYRRKNLAKISYASRVIANFVPNFVAMATGVNRGKCDWQHSMAYPRKPPYRRKNFLHKPSYSQYCPKFPCHGNGGQPGVNINVTINQAVPENPILEPKITTLSCTQPKL